jgi:hypothetical protein
LPRITLGISSSDAQPRQYVVNSNMVRMAIAAVRIEGQNDLRL